MSHGGNRMRRAAGLIVALAAILVAGCGGDDEPATAPLAAPGPLSKDAFIRQANEICISSESRIEAAADEYATAKNPPSRAQVARVGRGVVIPALEAEVQAIEALGKPAQGADQVARILALTRQGIDEIRRDPGTLLDGPPQQLVEANRLSKAFGAAECGISR